MKALLGVQSYFSFHWGTASPASWFDQAKERGFEYIGFADYASLHGYPEILREAERRAVPPLCGTTFPFTDGHSVIAFAETVDGYGNLCERITDWQNAFAARPSAYAGGIPALEPNTAGIRFLSPALVDGLVFITDDFPVWRALLRVGAEVYWRIGPSLARPPKGVSRNSLVFAPGPVLLSSCDFTTHRLLRAIGSGLTFDRIPAADSMELDASPVLLASPHNCLRTRKEYADAFSIYADAIKQADKLAERLSRFRPNTEIHCPPVPGEVGYEPDDNEGAQARLRRLAYEGAVIRYGEIDSKIKARLESELAMIAEKKFAEYFLVVHDIVNNLAGGDGRIKRGRSVTCGRGSGAASLVNYCLGVTNVNVMKHGLMFERFLNEARVDPPNIHVDISWDERDDMLKKEFENYGHNRVGRVSNHNSYDWRGAFRVTARALGHSDAAISRHLRESPSAYAADPLPPQTPEPIDATLLPVAERTAKRLGLLRRDTGTDWNTAVELSRRIIGFPHCLSMHCGGMIISPRRLCRTVPLIVSRKGLPTIQWEKEGAEEMGLVKIDLLGNRSLAVIRDAIRDINQATGIAEESVIAIDPTDDPDTRALLASGNTFGVFYMESPAMRLLMAKARVGDFEHAVIHSSIIRPAANSFINEYLRRLHGKGWEYEHYLLEGLF